MSDSSSAKARILERLTGADSPLRDELAVLAVDHTLSLRLRDAIDLEQLRALVVGALSGANVARIVERHVRSGWRRYALAIVGADTRVGALVPADARVRIHEIARRLRVPRAPWARGAIDPVLVRRLLAPVWTQVLLSFARRLPIPGLGAAPEAEGSRDAPRAVGFLARSVQQHAERLIDRGRTAMGGLGAEVERRLVEAARGFSDTAAETFRDALRQRIESEEGSALLAQITDGAVDRLLDAKFSELQRDADELPVDRIFDVLPEIVAHAAQTAHVRDIVQRELAAFIEVEGDRTLLALLTELGIATEVRGVLLERAGAFVSDFFRSPGFSAWIARVLAAAE